MKKGTFYQTLIHCHGDISEHASMCCLQVMTKGGLSFYCITLVLNRNVYP